MTRNITEIARNIVRTSSQIAPSFPEQMIVSLTNGIYNDKGTLRQQLLQDINRFIENDAMYDHRSIEIEPISWVNENEADRFSEILIDTIEQGDGVPRADRKTYTAMVKPLFSPKDGIEFVPFANVASNRYCPDNMILNPEQCRKALGLTEAEISSIVVFLEELSNHVRKPNNVIDAFNKKSRKRVDGTIRIAVGPYADTLLIPAIIYAVSDLVGEDCAPLRFVPASFFESPPTKYEKENHDCSEPYNFEIGYSVKASSQKFKDAKYSIEGIFDYGITRSILARNPRGRKHLIARRLCSTR